MTRDDLLACCLAKPGAWQPAERHVQQHPNGYIVGAGHERGQR